MNYGNDFLVFVHEIHHQQLGSPDQSWKKPPRHGRFLHWWIGEICLCSALVKPLLIALSPIYFCISGVARFLHMLCIFWYDVIFPPFLIFCFSVFRIYGRESTYTYILILHKSTRGVQGHHHAMDATCTGGTNDRKPRRRQSICTPYALCGSTKAVRPIRGEGVYKIRTKNLANHRTCMINVMILHTHVPSHRVVCSYRIARYELIQIGLKKSKGDQTT